MRYWKSFFVQAGIGEAAAARYAGLFIRNQIQEHILPDLNVEFMRCMGINTIGDIIAILKYGKSHHERLTQGKVLKASFGATIGPVRPKSTKPAQLLYQPPRKRMEVEEMDTSEAIDVGEARSIRLEQLRAKISPLNRVNKSAAAAAAVPVTVSKKSVFQRLGKATTTRRNEEGRVAKRTAVTSKKSSMKKDWIPTKTKRIVKEKLGPVKNHSAGRTTTEGFVRTTAPKRLGGRREATVRRGVKSVFDRLGKKC